jgi:hypothetical protein
VSPLLHRVSKAREEENDALGLPALCPGAEMDELPYSCAQQAQHLAGRPEVGPASLQHCTHSLRNNLHK